MVGNVIPVSGDKYLEYLKYIVSSPHRFLERKRKVTSDSQEKRKNKDQTGFYHEADTTIAHTLCSSGVLFLGSRCGERRQRLG